MHSTAYYVSPSGSVSPISGNTFDHDDFQKQHLPNGWRGPFVTYQVADLIASRMPGKRHEPPSTEQIEAPTE